MHYTLNIKTTGLPDLAGCEITNEQGELLIALTPRYPSPKAAIKAALNYLTENDLQAVTQ